MKIVNGYRSLTIHIVEFIDKRLSSQTSWHMSWHTHVPMWHWAHFGGVLTESWGIYCWYTAGFRNDMGWQNVEFVINWFVYRYFIQIWTNQWEGYSKLISRFYIDRFIVAKYSFGPIVSPPTLSKDGNLCWEHRSNEKCWRTSENIRNTVSLKIFSSFSQFLLVALLCHRLPKTTSFARGEWKQPWILEDLNLYVKEAALTCKSYEREAVLTFVKKKKHPPGPLFHPVGTSLDENSQDRPSVGRSDASRKGSPEHKLFVCPSVKRSSNISSLCLPIHCPLSTDWSI